jgi:hypothetical protein
MQEAALEAVAPDVWSVAHHLRFPGGVRLPARMTVIRLPSGELLLHSPIPIGDGLAAELAKLGPVRCVVAPNLLHHLFVVPCLERYPAAWLYVAPGLERKRPDLSAPRRMVQGLGDEAPAAWRGVIDQRLIAGAPRINEVVFLHRPSGTLVTCDLAFNVARPEGWATGLVLRMMGTHGRLRQSRLWRLYVRDRQAVRTSLAAVMAWPFEHLCVCHGDPVRADARAALGRALWILEPVAVS